MLVLSRKMNESVIIDGGIRVMVVGVRETRFASDSRPPAGSESSGRSCGVPSKPTGEDTTPPASADASESCLASATLVELGISAPSREVMTDIELLENGSSGTKRTTIVGAE